MEISQITTIVLSVLYLLESLLNFRLKKENEKFLQTIIDIQEIADKIDDSDGCAYGDYNCDSCSCLENEAACTYKVKKLILQKISKCEGEDDK